MAEANCTISVWVTPGASRDEVAGLRQDLVHLRVSAPPRDGRANTAVEALLARSLEIPVSHVSILRGRTSRGKLVAIRGLADDEVRRRLRLEPPSLGR